MDGPAKDDGSAASQERRPFRGIIRELKEEDLPQIRPILEAWVRWPPVTGPIIQDEVEEILALMKNNCLKENTSEFFVATENNKVIGVVGMDSPSSEMRPFTKTLNPIEIPHLYAAPAKIRGHGVGTALINKIKEEATRRGHTEIILNSGPRYKTAWPFYDQLPGFSRVGVANNLYGPRADAPVWRSELPQPQTSKG